MEYEAIAIELLRKVGQNGVTPDAIQLVLEAFAAVQPVVAPAKATKVAAPEVVVEPVVEPAPEVVPEAPAA
jgi:hypothetical protein